MYHSHKKQVCREKQFNKQSVLEGSLRNTGIHACGVIITPDDITNFVPVATAKDSDLVVTQFDNSVVEDAGLVENGLFRIEDLDLNQRYRQIS